MMPTKNDKKRSVLPLMGREEPEDTEVEGRSRRREEPGRSRGPDDTVRNQLDSLEHIL